MASGSRNWQYLACVSGNLATTCIGQVFTWSSSALQKLKGDNWEETSPLSHPVTVEQESWIGSLVQVGAIFGPILSFILVDKIGRKKTLIATAIPYILSWILLATTKSVIQIYCARIIAGLSVGAVFATLPAYIGEISDKEIRGAMGSFLQLFLTLGFMVSFTVGPYVSFINFAIISTVVPVLFLIIFPFMPESPYYFLKHNDEKKAGESLIKLRGKPDSDIQTELFEMKAYVEASKQRKGQFTDLIKEKAIRKSMIIAIGLLAFQQLCGMNAVLAYTEDIFKAANGDLPSEINTIIIGAVQVVSSCFVPLIVDRLGRKLLLQISGVAMAIGLLFLGLFFLFMDRLNMDVSAVQFLPITSLVFYVIAFCFGFGSVPWVIVSEIFPSHIKSLASTVLASICWIIGFLVIKFFPLLLDTMGKDYGFWLFGVLSFMGAIFTTILLPETKGKSLQEIQELLENGLSLPEKPQIEKA
ncbi:facilitated trehalose transporter Tret1-like [Chrysoperla carnea]|uniref:facilitated trehalose transporter Tret1-like n=1 Tax=Chrysoperla carnea TaxID=189513 RepID=UPI001D071C76|nr:facilitated trehalose transporter Tret1-like [Chrysoperla carnea]